MSIITPPVSAGSPGSGTVLSYQSTITLPNTTGSPDLTPLVNLTIYDKDPNTLFTTATSPVVIQNLFPGWNPVPGNTEVALLQAMSVVASELIFAINRVPGAVVDILLQLFGVTRSLGTAPSASVTFNCADQLGHTIPAGTISRLILSEGKAVDFATLQDLVINVGASVGSVGATGLFNTTVANNTPAGTGLIPISPVGTFINSVVFASTVLGGVDPEDTTAWEARGVQTLQRLSSTLVTPTQFQQAALNNPAVYRCTTVNNWNAQGAASAVGYVTVAVYGQGGASCTPAVISAVQTSLANQAEVNLNVQVVSPTITSVNVTCTVVRLANFLDTDVQAGVLSALQSYLSTDTWPWEGTVRINKILNVIQNTAGVDYCSSLSVSAPVPGVTGSSSSVSDTDGDVSTDIVLSGIANLAEYGTLNVSVVDPS